MPGAEGGGGRGAGATARALRRPPHSPRGGSVRPAPASASSGSLAASRKRGAGCARRRVCRGARLSPRGSSAGWGSRPGRPGPASAARSGPELSLWLLPPRRHRERLCDPRHGLPPQCPLPPGLPDSREPVSAHPPFRTRLRNGSPRGMPREPAVKPAWSWGLSDLELHSCGMGDIASPLAGFPQPSVSGGAQLVG